MAQTIEGFVGTSLDDAKISPLHIRVIALIAAGYFFDVIDLIVLGSLIPDMVQSKFATGGRGRPGRQRDRVRHVHRRCRTGPVQRPVGPQVGLSVQPLLFGIFTILGALAPTVSGWWSRRFIAGIGLGAEQPLAFAYAGEYSPKLIRGRILAIVHFIGGACVWPIAALFTLAFRDSIGWRGVWIVIGIGALVVWLFRFTLPESPRYLATHGRGKDALDVLVRLGFRGRRSRSAPTQRATPKAIRSRSCSRSSRCA